MGDFSLPLFTDQHISDVDKNVVKMNCSLQFVFKSYHNQILSLYFHVAQNQILSYTKNHLTSGYAAGIILGYYTLQKEHTLKGSLALNEIAPLSDIA